MKLTMNGAQTEVAPKTTLEQLLAAHEIRHDVKGVAVAINETVVPRGSWNTHPLKDGDTIEIIHAVQGG